MGLVNTLELQLGLTEPSVAEAVRIAAYASKIKASLEIEPTAFFGASFVKDPWATAKVSLGWRDQLVAAGWARSTTGVKRPDDLARVEGEGVELPPGPSERLFAVGEKYLNCRKIEPFKRRRAEAEGELNWRDPLLDTANSGHLTLPSDDKNSIRVGTGIFRSRVKIL